MATVRTMSSAAKLVVRHGLLPFCPKISTMCLKEPSVLSIVPVRWASYTRSPNMNERPVQTEVEIIDDPAVWARVERLFGPPTIPNFTPKEEYPSGWTPPKNRDPNSPYFVLRSRSHMPSVYLDYNRYTLRKLTRVKRIQGDIWAFEMDLKDYLQRREKKLIDTCVNEAFCTVYIRGDHYNNTLEWVIEKGF